MMAVSPPVFRVIQEPHGYFLDDMPLESPSSVFAELGLVDPRFYTVEGRARGRAGHAWLAEALAGRSYAEADPDIKLYVESGLRFVERRRPRILRLETSLYHPLALYAGTFDAEWELDGWEWIVDWKTGKAPKVAKYQTAAYAMMAEKPGARRRYKRAAFELQPDGSMANLIPHDDYSDGQGWLNLLGAARIRKELRAKKLEALATGEW